MITLLVIMNTWLLYRAYKHDWNWDVVFGNVWSTADSVSAVLSQITIGLDIMALIAICLEYLP